jgi:hypothetical protein
MTEYRGLNPMTDEQMVRSACRYAHALEGKPFEEAFDRILAAGKEVHAAAAAILLEHCGWSMEQDKCHPEGGRNVTCRECVEYRDLATAIYFYEIAL